MKKYTFFLLSFATISLSNAQPSIQWQKCLGGTTGDWAQSIQQTNDSGYIVGGYTSSNNGDVTDANGSDEFWVSKLSSSGVLQWQKCLGGSGFDQCYSIQQTADSGYIVAGFTTSNDSDVTGNHGTDDYWIVKLSSSGNIQWQTCLGGSGLDDALCIKQTADGGFIVSGDTQSNNGDVSGNHGGFDSWIVKLDASGNIQWQKCFGGTGDDTTPSVVPIADNGFIVAGSTSSNDGDVSGNHGGFDFWILKLDSSGNIQWQKCLGGAGEDIGYSIRPTADSGYVVSGFTKSTNGDVSGLHGTQPDYWVVKLNSTGNIQWQKCLGGTGDDKSYSIVQTNDSCYVVAGYAKSNDGDVSGNHLSGTQDYWLVKLSIAGNIQWQLCLGGTGADWARSVQQTTDSGIVVAGFTTSNNGDVSGNHGNNDYWIVKLNSVVTGIKQNDTSDWSVFPNPSSGIFSINASKMVDNAELKILNSLGQPVFQSHIDEEKTQVDLTKYSAGIYFVIIAGEKHKWTGKIVVE